MSENSKRTGQKTAHYIASTHWDREWYETFQGFRMRLVYLLDEVFDHLEKGGFAFFEMDGQAVPVLDYLEVRVGAEDRIRRLSESGKFRIGPWFVLPDEWLVSGESLVRNLDMGLEITGRFGSARPRTAPLVDEFGHVSQMPQILSQFGFAGTFLHRGINLKDCAANFKWQSPDGSLILSHRFARQGYGTLQIAYRRVLETDEPFDFEKTVDRLVEWTLVEAERTPEGPILLLDSCDHVEIEPETPEILAAANRKLKKHGIKIVHSHSDSYVTELVEASAFARNSSIQGELRDSARDSVLVDATWLISGVLSSRVRLKQANARCEDELCLWAEPFGAFAAGLSGVSYPAEFLTLAWRHLLENHAHDSICGCSIDQVHKDMEYRFDQSHGISSRLTKASLLAIAHAAAPEKLPKDALAVTLFNPTAGEICSPVDMEVRLPASWPEKYQEFFGYEEKFAFRVTDPDGREVPWQLNGQKRDRKGFRRPHRKIPVEDARHVVEATASVRIPAFGFTTLVVEPVAGPTRHLGTQRTGERTMENEFLRVEVGSDGTVTLLDKTSGASFSGLFFYEECADIGDGWNWCPPVNDFVTTSAGSNWAMSVTADGPEKTTFQITTRWRVPEAFDFKEMRRSGTEKEMIIVNRLTLRRGARVLESAIEVENPAEDHRLRVYFPTHLQADTYWADSAFDMVERPVALSADNAIRRELDVDGRPQQSWTALEDGRHGLAAVSRGLYESGVADRPDRALFLTLLRGIRKAVLSNDNPGGQTLGRHSFRVDLVPFSGKIPAKDLFLAGQRLNSPIRLVDLLERDITNRSKSRLPLNHSFFHVQGDVVVTSIRLKEENQWTVRLFNPSNEPADFVIGKPDQFMAASARDLSGGTDPVCQMSLDAGMVSGTLGSKRIATLSLVLTTCPGGESVSGEEANPQGRQRKPKKSVARRQS